jgi:poly(A) polymerase
MIAELFRKVLGRGRSINRPKLTIHAVKRHGIRREDISPCALRVTESLQKAGFEAFVVGGAVRDLLIGRAPKDFDVATNATPEQVKKVIRRSRIIGRRFQIVHALCNDEVVEVSTFRALQAAPEDDQAADEHGRLIRDNVFGSQEEDALRRDFTVNALFYDPNKEEVWDYFDGLGDIRAKRLRMIGEPAQRYREDPVRMLRAVRFAAKLGFTIDKAARKPILELADLLSNVPSARLFDEMLKLLLSGHSVECLRQLRTEGLHHGLLPLLDVVLDEPEGARFVELALSNTDKRIAEDKPISPGFLFASLLWHQVRLGAARIESQGELPTPALYLAMDEVLDAQKEKLAIPRRFDAVMKEIWSMQQRFMQRGGQRPYRLLEHPRFRAAFDFFVLRAASGEVDQDIARWWEDFQHADDTEKEAMLVVEDKPKRRRKRGPRRKKPAGENSSTALDTHSKHTQPDEDDLDD